MPSGLVSPCGSSSSGEIIPAASFSHVVSQDAFLLDQLDLRPADVIDALRRQVSRYHREPRNTEALLTILGSPGSGCPGFAKSCRRML